MEVSKQAAGEFQVESSFAFIELEVCDDSKWIRYDDCLGESGSLTIHEKVKEQLTSNPVESIVDEETLADADFALDRFVTRDGLRYFECD